MPGPARRFFAGSSVVESSFVPLPAAWAGLLMTFGLACIPEIVRAQQVEHSKTLVSPDPAEFSNFGAAGAAVGSANRDGTGDFLIGAWGKDAGFDQACPAHLFTTTAPSDTTAPDPPVGLQASGPGSIRIELQWTDSDSPGVALCPLYRSTAAIGSSDPGPKRLPLWGLTKGPSAGVPDGKMGSSIRVPIAWVPTGNLEGISSEALSGKDTTS